MRGKVNDGVDNPADRLKVHFFNLTLLNEEVPCGRRAGLSRSSCTAASMRRLATGSGARRRLFGREKTLDRRLRVALTRLQIAEKDNALQMYSAPAQSPFHSVPRHLFRGHLGARVRSAEGP